MDLTLITLAPLLVFLALLAVAGLAFLIYSLFYRRRIDRALSENRSAGPTPEPRIVGRLILGLGAAACVLGFLIWANRLQNRLTELEQNLSGNIYNVASRIEANNQFFLDQLQQANSPFESFEYEITQMDLPNSSMTVTFRATPKQASVDATVTLRRGDELVELTRSGNGVYSASVSLNPFRQPGDETAILSLIQDGVEQNESVTLSLDDWKYQDALPQVYVDAPCTVEWSPGKSNLDATLFFTVYNPSRLRSLSLSVEQNGALLRREDLYDSYLRGNNEPSVEFDCPWTESYPAEAEITLHLGYEDVNGLHYELLLLRLTPNKDLDNTMRMRILNDAGELLTEYNLEGE